MNWFRKIAKCSHAGAEVLFSVGGKRFNVCERCGRLLGYNEVMEKWQYLGDMTEYYSQLRRREVQAQNALLAEERKGQDIDGERARQQRTVSQGSER